MNIIVKILAIVFLVSCCFVASTKAQQVQDGQFCDICTFVVQQAELYANQSEPQIQQALLTVCSKLPTTLGNLCNTVVLVYGHQIIEFILKQENPQRVCCQLHLCSNCTSSVEKPVIPEIVRPVETNEVMCDMCTFAVGQVETFLAQNQTEEQIKKSLGLVCSIIPSAFEQQCRNIVDKYVPSIIYYLESEYPPEAVCSMVGLCSKKKPILALPVVKKSNDASCDLCKFGIGQIEAWIAQNETQALIQKRLSMICTLLPAGFKEQCSALVEQVPQIITFLEQTYTPEVICQLIGVCPTDRVAKPIATKNDGECTLCKFGIGQIEAWIASNETQRAIQARLGLICDIIPVFKGECQALVAQVPTIIQNLEQQYTPDVICQMIGVCSSKILSTPVKKANDANCDLCKFGIGQIEAWIATNETETRIQQRLSMICSLLPGGFRDQCFSLVDQVPQIITFLEQTYTPEVICQIIGVCPTDKIPQPVNKKNDGICEMCKFGVSQVEAWVASNQTEKAIQQRLSLICSLLPVYKDECLNMVDRVPAIIKDLEAKYTPEVICQRIGLCSAKVVKKSNDGNCDLCKFGISQIEAWVASNQTVSFIQQRLGLICDLIPSMFKQECADIVSQVPQAIAYLEQQYTPEVICQLLGVCSAKRVPKPANKKNDANCELCKFGVSQIEAWVASNQTETLIQKRLSMICSLLPGGFKDQCFSLVDQVPQIVTFLEQTYTPEVICQLLGICPTDYVVAKKESNDGTCDLCKFGVSQIEAWIASNQTETAIQQRLTLICSLIPVFKSECLKLVDDVPAIIQHLQQQYDPETICKLLGLCSSKKLVVNKANDGTCDLCKFGVSQIEAWVASNQTISFIQQRMGLVCNLLPGGFKEECLSLVNQVPQIINYLEQTYTPEVICQMIGVCSSKKVATNSNDANCDLCKFGVGQIEAWIASNETETRIQQRLTLICSLLPSGFKEECLSLVDQVPSIISYLEQAYTPEVICQLIGVCPTNKPVVKNTNDASCDLCKFGVSQIEAWIASNETETRIQQRLSLICSLLPSGFKDECLSLVEQVPQIINYLEQTYTPEAICQILGVCSSKKDVAPASNDAILCPACMFVVGLIEQEVQSNHTAEDVKKALSKVCSKLPHPLSDACNGIVQEFTPQIIDMILKKLDPSAICTALKLCKKRTRTAVISPQLQRLLKSKDSSYCPLCLQVASFLEDQISAQATVEQVITALKQVCDTVPEGFRALCKQVVPAAYQELIKFILDKEPPKVICQQLQMCSKNEIDALMKPKNSDLICTGCKQLVQIADSYITQESTKQEITQIVQNVCQYFPKDYTDMCKAVIAEYGPQLIEQLASKILDPTKVCTAVHACQSSNLSSRQTLMKLN